MEDINKHKIKYKIKKYNNKIYFEIEDEEFYELVAHLQQEDNKETERKLREKIYFFPFYYKEDRSILEDFGLEQEKEDKIRKELEDKIINELKKRRQKVKKIEKKGIGGYFGTMLENLLKRKKKKNKKEIKIKKIEEIKDIEKIEDIEKTEDIDQTEKRKNLFKRIEEYIKKEGSKEDLATFTIFKINYGVKNFNQEELSIIDDNKLITVLKEHNLTPKKEKKENLEALIEYYDSEKKKKIIKYEIISKILKKTLKPNTIAQKIKRLKERLENKFKEDFKILSI